MLPALVLQWVLYCAYNARLERCAFYDFGAVPKPSLPFYRPVAHHMPSSQQVAVVPSTSPSPARRELAQLSGEASHSPQLGGGSLHRQLSLESGATLSDSGEIVLKAPAAAKCAAHEVTALLLSSSPGVSFHPIGHCDPNIYVVNANELTARGIFTTVSHVDSSQPVIADFGECRYGA